MVTKNTKENRFRVFAAFDTFVDFVI